MEKLSTNVKLIWQTPNAEELITYIARVSNPKNQDNQTTESIERLIKFLIREKHWSPFEMVDFCFEICTTRAISAQIIRHRSFSFQEFSQRYATLKPKDFITPDIRYKGTSNRQSSLNREDSNTDAFTNAVNICTAASSIQTSLIAYNKLLDNGVAPESARMILPMCSPTRIYMKGSLRSWIHYLEVRDDEHTQKEHQEIASQIKETLKTILPITSKALDW